MDQRTAAIDQDLKDIIETRIDIAEKLELLEQRIKDTAEGVTMKFSRMLNEGTDSVTHLVDKTKAALDPIHKVDDYPWLMLGGAICAGYAIGLLESRARATGCLCLLPTRSLRVESDAGTKPPRSRCQWLRRHL